MKADQIEVRSEALTIFEFVQDMGPRRARKLASKIPYNHPLRGEARELAQKHWEDLAILLLEKQKRDTGRKVLPAVPADRTERRWTSIRPSGLSERRGWSESSGNATRE
jgi:hypothetical protein